MARMAIKQKRRGKDEAKSTARAASAGVGLTSATTQTKCHKYNGKGNCPSRTIENDNGNGSGEAGLPSAKTWVKGHHSFMTSMKTMEKTIAKQAKKVDRKKSETHKRHH